VNWPDLIAKIAAPLLAALLGGCIHLWMRVAAIEANLQRESQTSDRMEVALNSISLLVTKVDTLLEVSMRRLDMLERQVFKV
jgi:hypothetical protein